MNAEVEKKIAKFERMINDVLKTDLAQLSERLDSKNTDLAEFLQLKSVITTLQSTSLDKAGFKTQVDIGANFFVEAHVENASTLLLDVGLGHFVEFTLEEALVVIDVRAKLFERQIANLRKEVAKTNAHIKLLLLGIGELRGMNKIDEPERWEV